MQTPEQIAETMKQIKGEINSPVTFNRTMKHRNRYAPMGKIFLVAKALTKSGTKEAHLLIDKNLTDQKDAQCKQILLEKLGETW